MRTLLCLSFWLFSISVLAQFSEEKIIATCEVCRPVDLVGVDLDNDGDMDVVSASVEDNKIAWYENDGKGVFSEQKIITTSLTHPNSIDVADIDGDGKLDILITSWKEDKIVWFKNLH